LLQIDTKLDGQRIITHGKPYLGINQGFSFVSAARFELAGFSFPASAFLLQPLRSTRPVSPVTFWPLAFPRREAPRSAVRTGVVTVNLARKRDAHASWRHRPSSLSAGVTRKNLDADWSLTADLSQRSA
jgi:hypothetical protein